MSEPRSSTEAVPVLELVDVDAAYGPFRALFGVSLHVGAGHALALVGSNGAGKTTLARVASGLVAPSSGVVRVGGDDLTGRPAYEFARAGVAHAVEGRAIFATLSVAENLELSFRRSLGRNGVDAAIDAAVDLFPVLGDRRNQAAGTLSGGEQRMLSMARVMVEKPKVLVADELSLGLAPIIVDQLYEALAKLRDDGTSLLIIEQQVGHALELCDQVAILDHGTVTWTGPADDARDRVAQAFAPTG